MGVGRLGLARLADEAVRAAKLREETGPEAGDTMVPKPPKTTAFTGLKSRAATPLSNSPNSFAPERKTLDTAETRDPYPVHLEPREETRARMW